MAHNREHHQAMDSLVNLFTKANHDLTVVQHRLEKEFQQVYPDNRSIIHYYDGILNFEYCLQANPINLVSRIKKMQEDLLNLKEQCHELLAAKQDLIDKARTTLIGNRSLLQRMQASVGIPLTCDSDDSAFANFNQNSANQNLFAGRNQLNIVDEWAVQVRSRTGDERQESDAQDINKLLFSAIVQTN
ncbi:hypothetical protein CJ030_MR8G027381 [Morella rubra]|uniref:Protein FAM33A n=1 Tax=Morella rubra TaxID=262757 RepID=A0A6A1UWM1_9ROSI|nr:hypothetical protein CJ030_MR8G027381 [Morella rubra]